MEIFQCVISRPCSITSFLEAVSRDLAKYAFLHETLRNIAVECDAIGARAPLEMALKCWIGISKNKQGRGGGGRDSYDEQLGDLHQVLTGIGKLSLARVLMSEDCEALLRCGFFLRKGRLVPPLCYVKLAEMSDAARPLVVAQKFQKCLLDELRAMEWDSLDLVDAMESVLRVFASANLNGAEEAFENFVIAGAEKITSGFGGLVSPLSFLSALPKENCASTIERLVIILLKLTVESDIGECMKIITDSCERASVPVPNLGLIKAIFRQSESALVLSQLARLQLLSEAPSSCVIEEGNDVLVKLYKTLNSVPLDAASAVNLVHKCPEAATRCYAIFEDVISEEADPAKVAHLLLILPTIKSDVFASRVLPLTIKMINDVDIATKLGNERTKIVGFRMLSKLAVTHPRLVPSLFLSLLFFFFLVIKSCLLCLSLYCVHFFLYFFCPLFPRKLTLLKIIPP